MNSTAIDGRGGETFPTDSHARPPIISHIRKAVDVEGDDLVPATGPNHSIATQPRSLLAMLVYHYAIGVLPSREIVSALRNDTPLRLLCQDDLPDWRLLRRFRRLNHDAVQRCLGRVLTGQLFVATRGEHLIPSVPDDSGLAEAEQRLTSAIWLDGMLADE